MDLEKFREKIDRIFRKFGNQQGYIEYDETYECIICDFVSQFSKAEDADLEIPSLEGL